MEPKLVQQPLFCSLPFRNIILNSCGEVSMCCDQRTQLGQINKDTDVIEDLWKNPLANEIRAATSCGELHSVCRSGGTCPFLTYEKVVGPAEVYEGAAYPLHLEISLPDSHCNIGGNKPNEDRPACIMCKRNFQPTQDNDITDLLCEKARPLMPFIRSLCVLGVAEPFWKGAAFKVLRALEFWKYRKQVQFMTNTNGICLTRKVIDHFFEEIDWSDISWSLDAATEETYVKIRRLPVFPTVVSHLKEFLSQRSERGLAGNHRVRIYNNINLINVHEMTAMVEMAADLGVDGLVMLPTQNYDDKIALGELLMNKSNLRIFEGHARKAYAAAERRGIHLEYSKSFGWSPKEKEQKQTELLKTRLKCL